MNSPKTHKKKSKMNFYPHLAITTILTVTTAHYLNVNGILPHDQAIQCGIMVDLGSFFPDLDTESTPSKWYFRLMIPIIPYLLYMEYYFGALTIVGLFLAAKVQHHRGWTHSYKVPVLIVLVSLLPGLIPGLDYFMPYTLVPISFGIVTHLLPDSIKTFLKRMLPI